MDQKPPIVIHSLHPYTEELFRDIFSANFEVKTADPFSFGDLENLVSTGHYKALVMAAETQAYPPAQLADLQRILKNARAKGLGVVMFSRHKQEVLTRAGLNPQEHYDAFQYRPCFPEELIAKVYGAIH